MCCATPGRMRAVHARFYASGKRASNAVKLSTSIRKDGREWDMLQKQEHLYGTMFTSGQVLVERHGAETEALVEGLRLQWSYGFPFTPKDVPVLTHAFHPYPAGMQPATARHLLMTILPGEAVLDPFVGGGTVIVEAMRAGRLGMGSDISPLALFVSRGRTWTTSASGLDDLRKASRCICAAAGNKLVDANARQIRGKDWDVIKSEINAYLNVRPEERSSLRDALWFVCAVAASRAAKLRRRIGRNIVANEFFHSVCVEYAGAVGRLTQAAIEGAAPALPQKPIIIRRDARTVGVSRDAFADSEEQGTDSREKVQVSGDFHAVLTSPPYPGVYDYLAHARQTRSGLGKMAQQGGQKSSASLFVESHVPTGRDWSEVWTSGEIGSKQRIRKARRREANSGEESSREIEWQRDQRDWLAATSSALKIGGRICILIGDGDGVDTRSSILKTVGELQEQNAMAPLELVGWATLKAAEGTRRNMRTEHLLLLEKKK
ncbi:unnamed protein product [Scytosiphon promiscuus]